MFLKRFIYIKDLKILLRKMDKAIITGASSGLGEKIGLKLKEKNFQIINISRNNSEFNDINCDLSKDDEINYTIKNIKENHSDFKVLILNAGIMPKAKIGEIDFDIDNLFKINITSSIKIVNALAKLIIKNCADIVIIGSTASFTSFPGDSAYSSTKTAVLGFVKYLQSEFKNEDVRVIGFYPGGFNSNLRGKGVVKEGYMDSNELAKLLVQILELPRLMEVSEIIVNRNKGVN